MSRVLWKGAISFGLVHLKFTNIFSFLMNFLLTSSSPLSLQSQSGEKRASPCSPSPRRSEAGSLPFSSLRRREVVGIWFLVSWPVVRVGLVPGGAERMARRPFRVNKVLLSPSLGAASGGADVRAVVWCLVAAARGSSSRRFVWIVRFSVRSTFCSCAPAGRGGEGSCRSWRVSPFWCCRWCWALSPAASRLRPAMVARGVAFGDGGSWRLASAMSPSAGRRVVRWWCCCDRYSFIGSGSRRVAAAEPCGLLHQEWRLFHGGSRYGDGGIG